MVVYMTEQHIEVIIGLIAHHQALCPLLRIPEKVSHHLSLVGQGQVEAVQVQVVLIVKVSVSRNPCPVLTVDAVHQTGQCAEVLIRPLLRLGVQEQPTCDQENKNGCCLYHRLQLKPVTYSGNNHDGNYKQPGEGLPEPLSYIVFIIAHSPKGIVKADYLSVRNSNKGGSQACKKISG